MSFPTLFQNCFSGLRFTFHVLQDVIYMEVDSMCFGRIWR